MKGIIILLNQTKFIDPYGEDEDFTEGEAEEVGKFISEDSKYVLTYFVDGQSNDRTVSILEL